MIPDAVTEQAERIRDLWMFSNTVALVVAAVVWGLVAFCVIRYRRRRDDEIPSQHGENIPIEILYTATPLAILGLFFALTVGVQRDATATVDDPDVVIDVVAFQWQWQFRYPDDDVVVTGTYDEPPVMVLPVGQTARLNLDTPDVAHSFWVPDFLSKRDVLPDVENAIDVDVTEAGEWTGVCAEFCGLDHYKMQFGVRAVSADEFEAWVDEQQERGT
ncbi:MAG: cytochrome c oxidase subunit II [Actinomycetota bacterium]